MTDINNGSNCAGIPFYMNNKNLIYLTNFFAVNPQKIDKLSSNAKPYLASNKRMPVLLVCLCTTLIYQGFVMVIVCQRFCYTQYWLNYFADKFWFEL